MQKAAKVIMTEYGGVFPQDFEAIRSLPGIGDYTAGAIGAFAFDLPVPAVDGNVLRVASRLAAFDGDVLATGNKKVLTAAVTGAQKGLPPAVFNQAIIELGALVCVPNGVPKCHECPLADRCEARAKGLETALPVRRAKTARRKEERTVLILREGERTALRKRPEKGLLAGLFEPFSMEGKRSLDEVRSYLLTLGITPHYLTPLGDALHIFTHVEWHMTGYEVILPFGTFEKMASDGAENPFSGLFLAERDDIDATYAVPGAYSAYRAFM
jgi:adenine-specific DNA glycosylase